MLEFKVYISYFVFVLAFGCRLLCCYYPVSYYGTSQLQLNHDDANTLSGLDTVFAFHAGEWTGSPVVKVVI